MQRVVINKFDSGAHGNQRRAAYMRMSDIRSIEFLAEKASSD
jgi:hypothetical protein